ncbi:multicopper oxidase family protein [Marinobacterium sp. D7]|uniref:multicopper oxidase family protein n=1 Tax=Marinobacterium ramblicola TaxID=2849041 RepID=UPI001C2DBF08|nr:multicopper oxidase family protein [Marinobacterium ramblicola]MBV1790231.1 multicopper oxidase family protein [Marinobacterium ramblicola]
MTILNRRRFLQTGLALAAATQIPRLVLADTSSDDLDYQLIVEPADIGLIEGTSTPAWCFNGGFPAPVIRARQNKPVRIEVVNRLAEPTTIHWHGLRIRNDMDGVPFLCQKPIQPGDTFVYEFTPPDAGTFWYHPHMNSIEQLGKGLVGILIVDEEQDPGFDLDLALAMKNWHVTPDGAFTVLSKPREAARMGTPGRLMTINGEQNPHYQVPAGGAVRLRFANVDNTLTYELNCSDPEVQILAIDGNPLAEPRPLAGYLIGPGMRLDLGLMAPESLGEQVHFTHRDKPLLSLISAEGDARAQRLPRLPMNPIPPPDLDNAETLSFAFEWDASINPVNENGEMHPVFWTINRVAWQGMSDGHIPPPLARLERGKTYIFSLENATQYHHPIHLHGHTFTILDSDSRQIDSYQSDTALLGKYERIRVAFVADNPGRWMYHCHVVDHMKTGLMGYVEVV